MFFKNVENNIMMGSFKKFKGPLRGESLSEKLSKILI